MPGPPLLFISHASVDAAVAEYLEAQARESIPGVTVFRTTRVGQIRPGVEWAGQVKENLREAALFLVLLTPTSVTRPWVLFEAGAAWMTRRPLVPVLAGGLRKEDVPEPLNTFQLLSAEDPVQAADAFRELGGSLADPDSFAARVRQLGATARDRALEKAGWKRMEIEGQVYAWEGPLEEMTEGRPFPAPYDLVNSLIRARLQVRPYFREHLLQGHLEDFRELYMLDDLGRKHLVMNPAEQVYMVRPK